MLYGEKEIQSSSLETWRNEWPNDYCIHIEHPEFTALCPRSGYPDFGKIVIDYYPNLLLVELKSIKLYVNNFRDKRISHENVVNEIFNKLWQEVKPESLRVIGDFTRRGGIKTVVTVKNGKHSFDLYSHETL